MVYFIICHKLGWTSRTISIHFFIFDGILHLSCDFFFAFSCNSTSSTAVCAYVFIVESFNMSLDFFKYYMIVSVRTWEEHIYFLVDVLNHISFFKPFKNRDDFYRQIFVEFVETVWTHAHNSFDFLVLEFFFKSFHVIIFKSRIITWKIATIYWIIKSFFVKQFH